METKGVGSRAEAGQAVGVGWGGVLAGNDGGMRIYAIWWEEQ